MINYPMSKHARIERKARFDYIENTVGFGEKEIAVATVISKTSTRPSRNVLTETGVILVFNCDTGRLITAFIATVSQGIALYKDCHNCTKCPCELVRLLNNNRYYQERQPK